jgi:xanthine dehydrogenase YagS FAD-binding subunit
VIPFDYERAGDARSAVATVAGRPGAVFLGAGTNLVDHMKLGVANPDLPSWANSSGSARCGQGWS